MGKVFVHSEAKVTLELLYFFSNLGENEMTNYIFKIDRRLPYLLDASGEKIFLVLRNPEVCFVFKNNLGSQHLGAGEYIFAGIEQGIWDRYVWKNGEQQHYMPVLKTESGIIVTDSMDIHRSSASSYELCSVEPFTQRKVY